LARIHRRPPSGRAARSRSPRAGMTARSPSPRAGTGVATSARGRRSGPRARSRGGRAKEPLHPPRAFEERVDPLHHRGIDGGRTWPSRAIASLLRATNVWYCRPRSAGPRSARGGGCGRKRHATPARRYGTSGCGRKPASPGLRVWPQAQHRHV
jgi:hypothetical protein